MKEQNNFNYQQHPQKPQIPSQTGVHRPRGWHERWMSRFGMVSQMPRTKELTIPNWLIGKSIVFYFLAMLACWGAFGFVPNYDFIIVACISVVLFFYGGQSISKSWAFKHQKSFLRNIFIVGLVIRLLWVLYCYFFFNPEYYGNNFGDTADTEWYMDFGHGLSLWLRGDSEYTLSQTIDQYMAAIDDTGYPMWLGIGYVFWGEWGDVFMPFLVKCIVGAYCAVSIYRVARRHFGEGVARTTAIFVCINPNMIYWCGTMFKEVEMLFLCCLAIDNFDRVLNSGKRYTFRSLLPGIFAGMALMFFRTVLGLVFFLAVFAHIVMASQRVMSLGKKILAGVLVGAVLVVSMGDRIRTQSQDLMEKVQSDSSQKEIEWRGKQKDKEGRQQTFAQYASAAVFAPLIFTIPFPTFNQATEKHILQVQLAGGSYIKNILSYFVIIVMIMMLISGEWRRHVFILSYTLGYLVVLVMSAFAQSGRFHMPIWPMLMLFAAYGIQIAKTNGQLKRWFSIALVIEVIACLAWNWFKLKGRGMI